MANKRGASAESQAAMYKSNKRWVTNRKRRLLRAQKKHPNNEQIAVALKGLHYRRKTPTTPAWSSTRRKIAVLIKEFKGRVDMGIFSANEKVSGPAMLLAGPKSAALPKTNSSEYAMFSLGARAKIITGGAN
jgi:hypothetical protein